MKYLLLSAAFAVSTAASLWAQQPRILPQVGGNDRDVQVLHLSDLIRDAVDQSPEAQSALHIVEAMKQRVSPAQALPDPVVAVGWAGNPVPFSIMPRDASSYRGVTVSEQFPYPGKLKLQGAIVSKDVETAQVNLTAIRRRIAEDCKVAYFEYFYLDHALQAAQRNKESLQQFAQIVEAQYRVGKAEQADVLRSQLELSLLLEKLIDLEAQRDEAKARINTLLVRSPESPLPGTDDVKPEELPASVESLYAGAVANDAVMAMDEKQIERGRLTVKLAERQMRPDFGLSAMLQQRSDQATMYGLTASVNIPIFSRTKQRPVIAEAAENLVAAEKTRDNRANEIRSSIKQQYLAASAANRLLSLYSKGVIPQASLAYESSLAAYRSGKGEMQAVLANINSQLSYEDEYYRQLAEYEKALARIESLTQAHSLQVDSTMKER